MGEWVGMGFFFSWGLQVNNEDDMEGGESIGTSLLKHGCTFPNPRHTSNCKRTKANCKLKGDFHALRCEHVSMLCNFWHIEYL